jgi:hypothetical protein
MMFSQESLRIGDMAAGTVLVYERAVRDEPLPQAAAQRLGTLDPAGAEIAADLLARWPGLQPQARIHLARRLLLRYLGEQAELADGDELQWRARLERLARPGDQPRG